MHHDAHQRKPVFFPLDPFLGDLLGAIMVPVHKILRLQDLFGKTAEWNLDSDEFLFQNEKRIVGQKLHFLILKHAGLH